MAVLFIVIGGAGAGGVGVSLLPSYWQTIGALFPPRHAVELFRNVRYFDGHNIVTPIAVLGAYALVGAAVIVLVERRRKTEQPAAAAGATEAASSTREPAAAFRRTSSPRSGSRCCSPRSSRFNYMSSGHEPIATDMPFGVVGSSPLPDDAQGSLFSLDVTEYANRGGSDRRRWTRARSTERSSRATRRVRQPAHRGLVHQRPFAPRHRRELRGSRQEERRDSHREQAVRANAARSQ